MTDLTREKGRVRILSVLPLPEKDRNPHADPPITVWQGPVFRRLAQVSANPETRHDFLLGFDAIRDHILTLPQLMLAHGVATLADYLHLKDHWFDNGAHGWWPGTDAERIMTRGLYQAFTEADASGLPLQCYWVIYNADSTVPQPGSVFTRLYFPRKPQYGTYNEAGDYTILFQFFTPPSPAWKSPQPPPEEPI